MSKHKVDVCPFCGAKPALQYGAGIQKYWWSCENIKCDIQPCSPAYNNIGSATRSWNKRYTKNIEVAVATKIFEELEGKIVNRVIWSGEVIWDSGLSVKTLKEKYL